MNNQMPILVHSYESLGTFDGPGLRLVVFLQGCNFRCLYCANPDTIDRKGESVPTTAEEILKMAVSQKPFFGKKGGITFSGGEPTMQAEALIPLFKMLKEEGIHICLDTNGGLWNKHVEELLSLTDLVLLDVKEFNNTRHKLLTERSNEQTLQTAKWLEENQKPMWLRYVLVPGYSDFEEDIRALGKHFESYQKIERIEVLPYHTLGSHKYELLGKTYQLKGVQENSPNQLEEAKKLFDTYFKNVYVN
ncbi:MAG: pyruvate formate-lyase-activating protein [Phocaeicola sp.]